MPIHKLITPSEWKKISSSTPIADQAIQTGLDKVYMNKTIYERLDNLIALYEACKTHQPKQEPVTELEQQVAKFISIIGNSSDINQIISSRKEMRDTWSNFIPNTSLEHVRPFKSDQSRQDKIKQRITDHLVALRHKKLLDVSTEDKQMDKLLKVKMLTPLEKEAYRVIPSDGLLWQLKQPEDSEKELKIEPFDTTELVAHGKATGTSIFILSPQGELFAGSSEIGKFHHSSFQSGGYVSYGGTMKVDQGKLSYIDDYSGHYQPHAPQFFNVLKEFKSRNLIKEDTLINKKFNEDAGIKIGSQTTFLNTRGFLGLPPLAKPKEAEKPTDHYEILKMWLMENVASDTHPIWRAFFEVMSEYLKQCKNEGVAIEDLDAHINEIQSLASELGINPSNTIDSAEFENHLNALTDFIKENKLLLQEVKGLDWMPKGKNETASENKL